MLPYQNARKAWELADGVEDEPELEASEKSIHLDTSPRRCGDDS